MLGGVGLGGFLGVMLGVQLVAVRRVGVFGRLVVLVFTMMAGCDAMMLRGVLMMFGGFFVMVGDRVRVRHCVFLAGGHRCPRGL